MVQPMVVQRHSGKMTRHVHDPANPLQVWTYPIVEFKRADATGYLRPMLPENVRDDTRPHKTKVDNRG